MAQGYLQVDVVSDVNNFPVQDAEITISSVDAPETVIRRLMTNSSGQTENVVLEAPPKALSLRPGDVRPYSEYQVAVSAPGYDGEEKERITIPEHTLYGEYPPKIAESEIKPTTESGEIVLSRVVVPQTIVVHDGLPSNASAKNYYVPYRDYIKNVASSEIYATWPQATIVANVLGNFRHNGGFAVGNFDGAEQLGQLVVGKSNIKNRTLNLDHSSIISGHWGFNSFW